MVELNGLLEVLRPGFYLLGVVAGQVHYLVIFHEKFDAVLHAFFRKLVSETVAARHELLEEK